MIFNHFNKVWYKRRSLDFFKEWGVSPAHKESCVFIPGFPNQDTFMPLPTYEGKNIRVGFKFREGPLSWCWFVWQTPDELDYVVIGGKTGGTCFSLQEASVRLRRYQT